MSVSYSVCSIILSLSLFVHMHQSVYLCLSMRKCICVCVFACLSLSPCVQSRIVHLPARSLCTEAVYRFLADGDVMYSNEASPGKIDKWIWVGDHNGNSKKLDTWHFQI